MASKLLKKKDDVSAKPNHPWRLLPDGSFEYPTPPPPRRPQPLPPQYQPPPARPPSPPPPPRESPRLPPIPQPLVPLELTTYTHEDIRAIVNRNLAEAQKSYLAV